MEEDMLKEVFKFRDPELVQLNEIDEAEEAVQGHPGREQLNESFIFSDPEQLNDEFGFQGAAQTDTELEQFIESNSSLKKRSWRLHIGSISILDIGLQQWFVMVPLDFWKPQAWLPENLKELNILKS